MKKTKVVIFFGGQSTEYEVSIKSARSIYKAIDKSKYEIIPIYIAKSGLWVKGDTPAKILASKEKLSYKKVLMMNSDNSRDLITFSDLKDQVSVKQQVIAFSILHGSLGEDGTIQGLFEFINMPYVGCGVLGSALGMNKIKQKQLLSYYKLPVVNFFGLNKNNFKSNLEKKALLKNIEKHFRKEYPLFVKPANNGSSVGVNKVRSIKQLEKALYDAAIYDSEILIEQGVEDIREIEVSVLGNDNPEVSVCGEIITKREFYDYEAKYKDKQTELIVPAKITAALTKKLQNYAKDAFLALNCFGMARVDFFIEKKSEKVWINEINTIPGFTSVSMYPKLWEYSGISYGNLIDKLVNLGLEKWQQKQQIKRSMSTNNNYD